MSATCLPATSIESMQNYHLSRQPILDRAAVEKRLNSSELEIEERTRLSEALIKTSGIVEICLASHTYKICTQQGHLLGGFGSSEHFFIGEQLYLSELENKEVFCRGDVSITFGHMIALGGDFYGIPGCPISLLKGSDQDKEIRFLAAFATLENANPEQVRLLIARIEEEYREVYNSEAPHHCYSSRLISSNHRLKDVKGDLDELLVDNSDHFFENAQDAYLIGHTIACREAALAGQSQDKNRLKKAYALEAFACHFLTDLFAAGHIRNQRGPLEDFLREKLGFSSAASKSLSGVLTGAQHEYDGERGLDVFTLENPNDPWRAYGDGFFFIPKSRVNQARAIQTVQQSIDEVAKAYKDRSVSPTQMINRIPLAHKFNHDPLYAIRDGQLEVFSNGEPVPITSKKDYLLKAVPLALGVLPEGYINGFIDAYISPFRIEFPPEIQNIQNVLGTIIVPRIERLTGKLWHVVGVASFAQVKAIAEENAALTQELMDTAKSTFEQGQQILGAVNRLAKQVEYLQLRFDMVPVRQAVGDIQTSFVQLRTYNQLDSQQLDHIRSTLWVAASRLMTIFLSVQENAEIFSDRSLLIAYAETQFPDRSSEEKKLESTRWFRQILRYQIAAFSTYLNLKYQQGNPADVIEEIRIFQNHLVTQIKVNRESIIPEILYAFHTYADIRQRAIQQQNDFEAFLENLEGVVNS